MDAETEAFLATLFAHVVARLHMRGETELAQDFQDGIDAGFLAMREKRREEESSGTVVGRLRLRMDDDGEIRLDQG